MTDPRLQGTQPIDDEVPFQDAKDVARDEAPRDEDALVTPAAAERERTEPDPTSNRRGASGACGRGRTARMTGISEMDGRERAPWRSRLP